MADWVEGWEKTGKGRLWRVSDPQLAHDPAIAETRRLLAEGMSHRKGAELAALLGNPDFRVRLNAQWELASRGLISWKTLSNVARDTGSRRPRLHALWGLGQLSRAFGAKVPLASLDRLQPLLSDSDPEIRAAAARLFGGAHVSRAQEDLRSLILDPDPRVAFHAILAYRELMSAFLGSGDLRVHISLRKQLQEMLPDWIQSRLPQPPSEGGVIWPDHPLVERVNSQDIADPGIRHATVLMIARLGQVNRSLSAQQGAFATLINHTNPEVRLTYLLAERELKEPGIARSLSDPDPRLVLEAARAIHDVPIPAALPKLAALLGAGDLSRLQQSAVDLDLLRKTNAGAIHFTGDEWLTWTLRRSVNAAFQIGDAAQATALATVATRNELPESVRIEALEDLGLWAKPPPVDRVVGLHRPLPPRDAAPARSALAAAWPGLRSSRSPLVLVAALDAASALEMPELPNLLTSLASHSDPTVRAAAEQHIARRQAIPVPELIARAESGPIDARQSALRALAAAPDPAAAEALSRWADRLAQGQVPPALQWDVLESIVLRIPNSASLRQWTNSWQKNDRLAAYRVALEGGDAARGRRLFSERADWGCQRCHKLSGEGGEVGPELTAVGKTRGREAVLQSILYPNDTIAPGFENLIITRRDGTVVVGVLKAERPEALELLTPEDGRVVIATRDIASRERGLSAMPEGLGEMMTRGELRDLIEALSQ
ncbi:MAG: HEAT repeat domain-containing protein [Verrucomicrobiales bacterium]|nr:HEAT repeat domain-containing protein [Verrucomicrobiales bacterium]